MAINIFQEASRRYKDFQGRGFIAKEGNVNGRDIYQAFVKEVAAEERGESYNNPWGAKTYEEKYGVPVDYFSDETYDDIVRDRYDKIVEKYKGEIESALDIGGFYDLFEKYGASRTNGFDPTVLDSLDSLEELIDFCRGADGIEIWMFRKAHGRNRREESDMIEGYRDDLSADLKRLINEMSLLKYEPYA